MSWLLLVVGLLLLLSLVPFSLELFIATEGRLRVEAMPRWGALSLGTWRPGASSTPGGRKQVTRPRDRARSRRRASWGKLRAVLTSDDFVASLGRWLGRLLRLLAPSNVRVRLRLGAGDPYETGRLWAALSQLVALLDRETSAELELEPDFVDEVFVLEARACFRIVPFVLIATGVGYFFTPAPWRALGSYARA